MLTPWKTNGPNINISWENQWIMPMENLMIPGKTKDTGYSNGCPHRKSHGVWKSGFLPLLGFWLGHTMQSFFSLQQKFYVNFQENWAQNSKCYCKVYKWCRFYQKLVKIFMWKRKTFNFHVKLIQENFWAYSIQRVMYWGSQKYFHIYSSMFQCQSHRLKSILAIWKSGGGWFHQLATFVCCHICYPTVQ